MFTHTRRRNPAQELRLAVECLPTRTKRAMLDGVLEGNIIVGAYTDRDGGVCPMLAAHRRGGRTNFASFARAWDRYTGAKGRPRRATERQILTLRAMLEASLATEDSWSLATVAAEHRELKQRMAAERAEREADRHRRRRPTGEHSRLGELSGRSGWAWMRPFRRLDDYAAALEALERAEQELAEREPVHR